MSDWTDHVYNGDTEFKNLEKEGKKVFVFLMKDSLYVDGYTGCPEDLHDDFYIGKTIIDYSEMENKDAFEVKDLDIGGFLGI